VFAPFRARRAWCKRARLAAPHRGVFRAGHLACRTDLGPRLRTKINRTFAVQQAPCAPVLVPVGRGPEASRELG
jgi:hypothetical protein